MMLFRLAGSFLSTDSATPLLRTASCVLAAATAPLAIELLALTAGSLLPERRRQKHIHPVVPIAPQRLTVVVPAHNEELLLSRCVASLLVDQPPTSSVLVVAHNCTDKTVRVAVESGAEVLVLRDDGRQGKGAALRAGFRHAVAQGAKVLAVVDADSVVAPGFSAAIAEALANGAEAFQARYVAMSGSQANVRLTALGFLGFNVIRPRGRARLGMSAGIFGNGFGLHSSALERVPYEANSVVEDLEYHLRLVDAGIRVAFLQNATVSSEMPQNSAAASSQRARWEGGRLRMARVWLPRLLRRAMVRRMILLEPALELACLPLASEVLLLTVCLSLPVPWLRIYAISAFAVILAHVAAAAAESDGGWWDGVRALLSVPRYLVWKLRMLPRTLASSSRNAAWVRTAREAGPSTPATITPIDRNQRPANGVPVRGRFVAGSNKGRR
jgi:cellulose synthase/poly-beta-1,6-N-acetylglucosamine synthase-like glycosyltransferase